MAWAADGAFIHHDAHPGGAGGRSNRHRHADANGVAHGKSIGVQDVLLAGIAEVLIVIPIEPRKHLVAVWVIAAQRHAHGKRVGVAGGKNGRSH